MTFAALFPILLFGLLAPWCDVLGLIMLCVICPIGWVVLRYSVRYLEGDAGKNRFLFWMATTLTATTALVAVHRLDLFFLCWIVVSLSLHKLLTFYPERPKAILCAQSKNIISRVGDFAILAGILLLYNLYGTLEFSSLFSLIRSAPQEHYITLELIALCFAIGAITKSAQLPFHHWLPDSLETPTPVSALMHAGVINAGGFLLIRLSPIFENIVYANVLLAVIGSLTAVFGMSAMITQPSIKKRLAYSTVGQMGFMIMQCGLGLYSLALLHIIAHAFYKAYAFLRSGSAMDQAQDQWYFPKRNLSVRTPVMASGIALSVLIGAFVVLSGKNDPYIVIYCIWSLVVVHMFLQVISTAKGMFHSFASAAGMIITMTALYYFSSIIIDGAIASYVPISWIYTDGIYSRGTILCVAAIFIGGFVLQAVVAKGGASHRFISLFTTLHNGFYFGIKRLFNTNITLAALNYNSANPPRDRREKVTPVAKKAVSQVAPLWGLQNFVAVNPFWGFRDKGFLETASLIEQYCHISIVGDASNEDSHIFTFSEFLDRAKQTSCSGIIVDEISKFCSLYFDRGQAVWQFPLKDKSLFKAWKSFAQEDKTLFFAGIRANDFIASLPDAYEEVFSIFDQCLDNVDLRCQEALFSRAIFTIKGWASYAQHLAFEDSKINKENLVCLELLAIRLAYDLMLMCSKEFASEIDSYRTSVLETVARVKPPSGTLYRDIEARESQFISHVQTHFQTESDHQALERPDLQAVFCIDVRSEGYRYFLEQQSLKIQTYGFAGFFGLTLRHQPYGTETEINQCAVLLQNSFTVADTVSSAASSMQRVFFEINKHLSGIIKTLRQSISSGFNFVEAFGILYLLEMMKDSLCLTRSRKKFSIATKISISLSRDEKIQAAQGILKNMGLSSPMAPVVLLCGHESETKNNPFNASLDCGACGGHSGRINALTAATILNDPEVRDGLRHGSIEIPADTMFIPAIHNTTTDEVSILVEDSKSPHLSMVRAWLSSASALSRKSRARFLSEQPSPESSICFRKSKDWSEVRPEWGLARNAGFIAARRMRTHLAPLENRCFLHEYDFSKDSDHSILELIMTAPMVVASWINLQYFASTIAPGVFSSGNKVIHNVVGQLGVILGNGGDLQVGLPMQSVHTGKEAFHDPLRLQVVLEAPEEAIQGIIEKHTLLQQLIQNEWVKVYSLDRQSSFIKRIKVESQATMAQAIFDGQRDGNSTREMAM